MSSSVHPLRTGPAGTPPDKLAFTTPSGRRRVSPARFGQESRRDRALPQLIRNCLLDDEGQQCVQVRLTAADAAHPAARALLDTEAGIAVRLHRALEDTEYAALFPRIVGYELDAAEPFLLYAAPRGMPAARTHVMAASDQQRFTRDLMLALCLLAEQGLVPRGVSPYTVLWDGARAQLWGLEAVTRAGQRRGPWGRPPFCSPEQRRGEGFADARDAVWSAAQVLYRLVTGRLGPADGPPADLAEHRVLDRTLRQAFAPRAADRPTPAEVLDLVAPGAARRVRLALPADEGRGDREAFEKALRLKRKAPVARARDDSGAVDGRGNREVLCPYCLETIQLDVTKLFVPDSRMQYRPLDVSRRNNPLVQPDVMRGAVQKCTADPEFPEHFIPVPYLTYGRPLTVAMVGQSSTGKSHLLTQMIGAITDGGLEPFGLKWQSVNPEQHARFVRERLQPLRNGKVLDHTPGLDLDDFARFVEALLITDARGHVHPVAFFDLGGEDLVRTDARLRFLLGVDALIFVVDPALALPLPQLDHVRERWGVEVNREGDLAFGTVLDRLPRSGPYLEVPAAIVLGKADLLRFQPPVDRWLSRPPATVLDPALTLEESRDVYGLLRRHAGRAWLRPFDVIRRCTLHIASATGGQEVHGRYPAGAGPRRVLEPLLVLLALHGLIEVPGRAEALAVGEEPGSEAVRWQETDDGSTGPEGGEGQ
ncbi:hypothetical protein ACFOOM_24530 [Streptomyces echinoruber]|uniref:Uncharacterized protein n=1 Tax=Streptomyces echinoruber TaxID=68898 RepID=A0A918R6Q3_9ACTN|nr:hypothetical protein [Streptomyces echinoruber]GGZ87289.1 hypothetical protein GCM10010389_27060 [Streptomyces echinoruber]